MYCDTGHLKTLPRRGLAINSVMREFETPLQLTEHFVELTRQLNPTTVFEVGAREAVYACKVSKLLPEAKVFAFEASPYNFDRFSKEVKDGGYPVEYLHLAVGDRDGTVEFYINSEINGVEETLYTGRNSILPRTGQAIATKVEVTITSLSTFVRERELDGPVAIWLDVEGATGDVLRGMSAVMDKVSLVHCEVEERRYWQDQWLRSDVDRFFLEHGLVPVARDDEYVTQYNVVYARV